MKKILVTIALSVLAISGMYSQAGMRLYGGLSSMSNEDKTLDPSGPAIGYHIGADMKLNDGGMSFLLGGRFTNLDYTTNESIYIGDKPQLQIINTRIGLAFQLFKITNNFIIHARALGSIDYLFNTPLLSSETAAGFEQYRNVNSTASAVGGVGVSIGPLTFDLEYGHGLFNLVNGLKETKPTYFSLSAGVMF